MSKNKKKLIEEYLKTTSYSKGTIYKIVPETLLEHFCKFLEQKEKENEQKG